MININKLKGYTDIVYAPNYISSSEGIMQLPEDTYDFDLDTYLVFNNQIYKTIGDFKDAIVQLLENNSNVQYNINVTNTSMYDCMEITCVYGSLNIYIPKTKKHDTPIQEQIIREYLLREVRLNGRLIGYRCPFKSLNDLILDMRNIFVK